MFKLIQRSLALKLTLVIVTVCLLGVAIVAIFAQVATRREFGQFVISRTRGNFADQVTDYYRANGTWDGLLASLPRPPRPPDGPLGGPPNGQPSLPPPRSISSGAPPRPLDSSPPRAANAPPDRPKGPAPNGGFSAHIVLLDTEGCVLTPSRLYRPGDCLEPAQYAGGAPVMVDEQQVGTVLTVNSVPELGGIERAYLMAINSALRNATLTAIGFAVVLGLLLARYLTRPLQELTNAIHAMTGGELEQEVVIRSQDELGELTASFNQMSADLAHANHLRRQMTADIAHDLRNPLVVLSGYIESMRDGVLKPTEARLKTMFEEVNHLQHLVDDLWTLSRADAGELQLMRVPTRPAELLERTAAAYAEQAEAKQVQLEVVASEDMDHVQVDPERMAQVLGNLVSNALRYTSEGGQIRLLARTVNGAADDAAADAANGGISGKTLALDVWDNGSGIAPEALPLIFERFYRADAARVQNEGESGLGLAIAKSIVTSHGGEITVQSTPGVETVFRIRLPVG